MGQENEGEPGMGSMRALGTLSGVGGRVRAREGGQHLTVDNGSTLDGRLQRITWTRE